MPIVILTLLLSTSIFFTLITGEAKLHGLLINQYYRNDMILITRKDTGIAADWLNRKAAVTLLQFKGSINKYFQCIDNPNCQEKLNQELIQIQQNYINNFDPQSDSVSLDKFLYELLSPKFESLPAYFYSKYFKNTWNTNQDLTNFIAIKYIISSNCKFLDEDGKHIRTKEHETQYYPAYYNSVYNSHTSTIYEQGILNSHFNPDLRSGTNTHFVISELMLSKLFTTQQVNEIMNNPKKYSIYIPQYTDEFQGFSEYGLPNTITISYTIPALIPFKQLEKYKRNPETVPSFITRKANKFETFSYTFTFTATGQLNIIQNIDPPTETSLNIIESPSPYVHMRIQNPNLAITANNPVLITNTYHGFTRSYHLNEQGNIVVDLARTTPGDTKLHRNLEFTNTNGINIGITSGYNNHRLENRLRSIKRQVFKYKNKLSDAQIKTLASESIDKNNYHFLNLSPVSQINANTINPQNIIDLNVTAMHQYRYGKLHRPIRVHGREYPAGAIVVGQLPYDNRNIHKPDQSHMRNFKVFDNSGNYLGAFTQHDYQNNMYFRHDKDMPKRHVHKKSFNRYDYQGAKPGKWQRYKHIIQKRGLAEHYRISRENKFKYIEKNKTPPKYRQIVQVMDFNYANDGRQVLNTRDLFANEDLELNPHPLEAQIDAAKHNTAFVNMESFLSSIYQAKANANQWGWDTNNQQQSFNGTATSYFMESSLIQHKNQRHRVEDIMWQERNGKSPLINRLISMTPAQIRDEILESMSLAEFHTTDMNTKQLMTTTHLKMLEYKASAMKFDALTVARTRHYHNSQLRTMRKLGINSYTQKRSAPHQGNGRLEILERALIDNKQGKSFLSYHEENIIRRTILAHQEYKQLQQEYYELVTKMDKCISGKLNHCR